MTETWYCKQLENLKSKANRLSTLKEVRRRLLETPDIEGKVIYHLLSSPEMYNCLDSEDITNGSNNMKLVVLLSDILRLCLKNPSLIKRSDLSQLLFRPLQQKSERIRTLALRHLFNQLQIMLKAGDERALAEAFSSDVINQLLLLIQDQEKPTVRIAYQILSGVLHYHLDDPTVIYTLGKALQNCAAIKFRIYSLAIGVAIISEDIMKKLEFVADHALNDLENGSVTMQIKVMETLGLLGEQYYGFEYLEKRKVFQNLVKRIQEMEHKTTDINLLMSIMHFFGEISAFLPTNIINGYPYMIRRLLKYFHTCDSMMLPTVLSTFENLTQTAEGIVLLEKKYPMSMKEVFEVYAVYLRDTDLKFRIRILESLENIFAFDEEMQLEDIEEASPTLKRWFGYLNNNTYDLVFLNDFYRDHDADVQIFAYFFIRSLCFYPWGSEAVMRTKGFFNYLLRFESDVDIDVKEAKLNVVLKLASSSIFDSITRIKLCSLVKILQNVLETDKKNSAKEQK